MVSFFNDVNVRGSDAWIPMAEYFATRGFFHDYNARPDEPLKLATAKAWAKGVQSLRAGNLDPQSLARDIAAAEQGTATITGAEFAALLPSPPKNEPPAALTRKDALALLWLQLPELGR